MSNEEVVQHADSQRRDVRLRLRGLLRFGGAEVAVLAALVILCVIMAFLSPSFLSPDNIFNVLQAMATIAIMGIGQTLVIVTAGIDLSVGSLMAVSAMLAARLIYYHGINPWLAVLLGIGLATVLGLANGLIITRIRINAFITTLGMLNIARGLVFVIASVGLEGTVASDIPFQDAGVSFLGSGYFGPVPVSVLIMFALVVLFSLFLSNTILGRQTYAVGSNEQAARLSGVNIDRVRLLAYVLTGALCGLAGILSAGLLSTATTNMGLGSELDVIAGVVIGGASLMGGEGTIAGTIIGTAIIAVLRNAFVLLGFPLYLQTIVIGVVIILAVAIDRFRRLHRG